MSIHRPRSVRGWLAWIGVALLVLLVLGAARRNGRSAPDATEVGATAPIAAATVVPTGRPDPGTSRGSLEIGGRTREWRVYVPSSLAPSGEVPLVIGLHGGLGSGEQFAADAYLDQQAERGGFIAVYPDGIERGRLLAARTWNAGGCCGTAMDREVDDVGFIAALVERLASELPIDGDRVYVTGHSNGAMMAQRLACDRADLFAAIAVYAGPLQTPCAPSEPISVLNIHGDADENILIGGGHGPRAVTDTDYTSLAATAASWVTSNGCDAMPEVSVTGAVTTSTWGGCDDGAVVETQVVAGASHSWPGGAPTGLLRADPSPDLDASSAVWDFLSTKVR
jgi:polyhydroxybutyrate depolymerase